MRACGAESATYPRQDPEGMEGNREVQEWNVATDLWKYWPLCQRRG